MSVNTLIIPEHQKRSISDCMVSMDNPDVKTLVIDYDPAIKRREHLNQFAGLGRTAIEAHAKRLAITNEFKNELERELNMWQFRLVKIRLLRKGRLKAFQLAKIRYIASQRSLEN